MCDYSGMGAPSHRLGRIHPYVWSCSPAAPWPPQVPSENGVADLNRCWMEERPKELI